MKLSEAGPLEAVVIRDATFENLGKANHRKPMMLGFAEDLKQARRAAANPRMACIVTTEALADEIPASLGLAVSDSPRLAFYRLHEHLAHHTSFYWEDFPTEISSEASVSPNAFVAEKNVRIGRGTVVEPHACVHERTIVGEGCVIRSGAIVGGAGFEFRSVGGTVIPVTHAGGLRLGDRVSVNHNTVIDRAVYGGWATVGDDTKIDSCTQIAHNVQIGRRCILGAVVAVSGNTVIGDDVRMGPGAVVSNGLEIGAGCWVSLGAVVVRNVPDGEKVSGNFAVEHARFRAWMNELRQRGFEPDEAG